MAILEERLPSSSSLQSRRLIPNSQTSITR
jgi:hypothetical protein